MIESRGTSVLRTVFRRSTPRSGRAFAVLSAVICVLSFNLLSTSMVGADAYWTNAVELPGLVSLDHTAPNAGQIVCTSSGNCVTGGEFTDSNDVEQAFLSQETDGVWSTTTVAAALNVGGFATVTAISCPAAGSCTAAGIYTDASTSRHTFVISQTNGTWGYPTEVPDYTALKFEDVSEMETLSCTSATTCQGVGAYVTHATDTGASIIYTETNGVWAVPVEPPGAASLNPSAAAVVNLLDCASTTTCVASGLLVSLSPLLLEPFFIDENNGVWETPELVPGLADLDKQGVALVASVSCGAPGDCTAGGDYVDDVGNTQAFAVSQIGGVWGSATQFFATQLLGNGLTNSVAGVSCFSAGTCTLLGTFNDAQNFPQSFYATEANHTWSPAVEIPGDSSLKTATGSTLSAMSCSAIGECSAGGNYSDVNGNTQAFFVNEVNGVWADPVEAPGSSSLNKGDSAGVYSMSCSSDGSCGVLGGYTDANKNVQLFVVNSSTVAPTEVSSPPRHVTAADKKGVITVRWSGPANDGGTAITSYTVVSLPRSKTCVTHATSCTFRGLNKKLHYSFEVRATNAVGSSALSAKSNAVRDT